MKESMAHKGYVQGDMSPKVEDYQKPEAGYTGTFPNKTTEYVERRNRFEDKGAAKIKQHDYKGRYS